MAKFKKVKRRRSQKTEDVLDPAIKGVAVGVGLMAIGASKPKGKKGKGYSIYVTEPGKEPKEVDKI